MAAYVRFLQDHLHLVRLGTGLCPNSYTKGSSEYSNRCLVQLGLSVNPSLPETAPHCFEFSLVSLSDFDFVASTNCVGLRASASSTLSWPILASKNLPQTLSSAIFVASLA